MGTWSYPLADGLGSVRQQTDGGGYVTQQVNYSPFGNVVAVAGVPLTGRGYTGERWDGDVGLLYLRARWYDPATGRFLTPDPFPGVVALPQTQHAYVYVANNPINLTDPSGQFIETPWDTVMVVIDAGMLVWDLYYCLALNPCIDRSEMWTTVGIDAAAFGIDLICLLTPFTPGGAGAINVSARGLVVSGQVIARVPQAARYGRAAVRGAQVGIHIAQMSRGGGNGRRTEHGESRHAAGDRPTGQAFQDRQNPREVYVDNETGNRIYIGGNARTHVFMPDGRHHTSFWTTRARAGSEMGNGPGC